MQKNKKSGAKWFVDVLWGLVIGFVNGFLGSGGGMVAVPILEKAKKLETKKAHATAVAVMLPFCVISGVIYALNQPLDWWTVGILAFAATIGGVFGCIFLKNLSGKAIKIIFAVVMAFAGVWVLVV